jgi:hypothetical protein
MARMHWFWRAAIAILAGLICYAVPQFQVQSIYFRLAVRIHALFSAPDLLDSEGRLRHQLLWQMVSCPVAYFLPPAIVAFGVYGVVTWRPRRSSQASGEESCRRCGYILRGLTEPRCPECGERI